MLWMPGLIPQDREGRSHACLFRLAWERTWDCLAIIRTTGFVPLRRGLFEHVVNGDMAPLECFLYSAILASADPKTGIWISSAGVLSGLFGIPHRTCRDLLEKLEKSGYVKRFPVQGRHGSYPILVHLFDCSDGAMKGMRLNAKESKDYKNPVYFSRHEDVNEGVNDNGNDGVNESATKNIENKRTRELEKKKPSRAKPEVDERHGEFREKLGSYWEWAKLGKMPWDGSEAKKMALTLKANPTMTLEEFGICLKNRHNSEGMNLSSRPRDWLERITDFRAGPLDRFNKLKNGASNGNHKNGKPTASQRATAELSAALLNFGTQGAPDPQSGRPAGPDAESADRLPATPRLGAKIIEVRPKDPAGSVRPGGGDVGGMANGVKDHSPDW